LISLKHINIERWNEMIDLDDIFDPSKILYLEADLMHLKQLRLFTNLRSLKLNTYCSKDELPKMLGLTSLTFGFTPNINLFGSIYEQC
jgi:hypothetical protein